MSSPSFTKQQELANKHPKDLEDHEKIYLLKREIDNLRGQIRESGAINGKPSSSSSSMQKSSSQQGGFCSSGFCRAPMLSIFLALAVVMIARWRRRQSVFHRRAAQAPEMTMQFELQDAHEYQGVPGGAIQQFV